MQESDSTGTLGESQHDPDEKVEKNVTLPKAFIARLRTAYPTATNDAEAIRRGLGDGIQLQEAKSYSIERREE